MKRVKKVSLQARQDTNSTASGRRIKPFQLHDHTDWILEAWARERPDLDVSSVAIINRLGWLQSYLHAAIGPVFERFGLTGPSFAVIATLRRVGAPYQLSQRALMDALRQVGVTKMDMPFTPLRVWQAIQAAKRAQPSA